ncbi:hypothetical protein [Kitasatospora sp. NPDC058478]|uniref:hypothetical protein n=1 Tax=unclassified Kitasatospora TaxID=2633591 RepID=UPI00364B0A40
MHELDQAVRENTLPDNSPLTPDLLETFLDAAEDGLYRTAPGGTGATSAVTNRVRVGCLNALSTLAGRPLNLEHRSSAPAAKRGTTSREERALRRYLDTANEKPLLDNDHARILLVIGLVLDTRSRSNELAAMRTTDISIEAPGGRNKPYLAARLRLNPQRRPGPERVLTGPIRLHPITVASLQRYLPIRERLVHELSAWTVLHPDQDVHPHHDYLFVSLQPNHTGGRPSVEGGTPLRPAGMPLQPQGLRRALDRAAERINATRRRGSRPLPTMEQLRKIVDQ